MPKSFSIKVADVDFVIEGQGHLDLILSHTEDIVITKEDLHLQLKDVNIQFVR